MRGSFKIATIGDIDVAVHFSWLLVFFLVAWTLAVGLFPAQSPGLSAGIYWAMGFVASLLLFASVLIHELAHSFVAESLGLRVRGITLFVFGGVSNISGEPRSARDELAISAVGPLSSLALAGVFWGIWFGLGDGFGPVASVTIYLAAINALLAAFNLIPGFPLDGGRVFRAIVWWVTNNLQTATSVAVGVGRAIAFVFILGGLFLAFTGAFLSGIWLALIGWFLYSAAKASLHQTSEIERFRGVKVRQVMETNPTTVEPTVSLEQVVHDYMLQRGMQAVPVVEDGRLRGVVTLNEVRSLPREHWDETQVQAAMTGVEGLLTVKPDDELSSALEVFGENEVSELPVVEDGRLVGMLSRSNLIRYLQVREDLGVSPGEEDEEHRRAA